MDSVDLESRHSQFRTRRVRFGLQKSKPREFKWEPKKVVVLSKPKNTAEFKEIAKKEMDLAAKFDNDRAVYDKFLDPDVVPTVDGSRRACGKRSTSLRKSGASSFNKVLNDAQSLSCTDRRYQINPSSPIKMTGTSKIHDLGAPDSSARSSLLWDGSIGSEGYQVQWVFDFPKHKHIHSYDTCSVSSGGGGGRVSGDILSLAISDSKHSQQSSNNQNGAMFSPLSHSIASSHENYSQDLYHTHSPHNSSQDMYSKDDFHFKDSTSDSSNLLGSSSINHNRNNGGDLSNSHQVFSSIDNQSFVSNASVCSSQEIYSKDHHHDSLTVDYSSDYLHAPSLDYQSKDSLYINNSNENDTNSSSSTSSIAHRQGQNDETYSKDALHALTDSIEYSTDLFHSSSQGALTRSEYSEDVFHTNKPQNQNQSTAMMSIEEASFNNDQLSMSDIGEYEEGGGEDIMGNHRGFILGRRTSQEASEKKAKSVYQSNEYLASKRLLFSRIINPPSPVRILPPQQNYDQIRSDHILVNLRTAAAEGDLLRIFQTLKFSSDDASFLAKPLTKFKKGGGGGSMSSFSDQGTRDLNTDTFDKDSFDQEGGAMFKDKEKEEESCGSSSHKMQHEESINKNNVKARTRSQVSISESSATSVSLDMFDGLDMDHVSSIMKKDDKCAGPTALHVACENGHTEVVSKLLKLGARVDAAADFGLTPLHVCALHGKQECCALLLAHASCEHVYQEGELQDGGEMAATKAFINDQSNTSLNDTPVLDPGAVFCGVHTRCLPLMGSVLSALTKQKRTALHCAVRAGNVEMVAMILEAISNCGGCEAMSTFVSSKPSTPNTVSREKIKTPPSSAAASSSSPTPLKSSNQRKSEYLSKPTRSSFIDYESMSVDELRLSKANEIIQVEQQGREQALFCFTNAVDDLGFTVLHDAAKRGQSEIVRLLLEAKSKPEMKAKGSKRTASELALEYGHIEVSKLINEYAAIAGKTDWAAGRLRGMYDTEVKATADTWHFLS